MFDLLTAIALICVSAGLGLVRIVPFHNRVWIGLALLAGSYCSAAIGLALVRAGLDSQLLRYVWAGSFGAMAIASVVFLVPSIQDWLRAKWRRGRLKQSAVS
jgi:high-affinity Fe2+/Pb2+ permease